MLITSRTDCTVAKLTYFLGRPLAADPTGCGTFGKIYMGPMSSVNMEPPPTVTTVFESQIFSSNSLHTSPKSPTKPPLTAPITLP